MGTSTNGTDPLDSGEYGGFPMSVVVTGFFITSLAYLICFCCCIIQFFVRKGRDLARTYNNNNDDNTGTFETTNNWQKNETLKKRFIKQFHYSLKRHKKKGSANNSPGGSDYGSCPICFEDYIGDPADIMIGLMKGCNHYFHFDCIWKWLEARATCPLCRTSVKLKESDVTGMSLRHIVDKEGFVPQTDSTEKYTSDDQGGTTEEANDTSTKSGKDNPAFVADDQNRDKAVKMASSSTSAKSTKSSNSIDQGSSGPTKSSLSPSSTSSASGATSCSSGEAVSQPNAVVSPTPVETPDSTASSSTELETVVVVDVHRTVNV